MKWKYYAEDENSWEPEKNLHCREIMEAYRGEQVTTARHVKQTKRQRKWERDPNR